ncbi:hypothetical protein ES705_21953 [subsurface metagenome]
MKTEAVEQEQVKKKEVAVGAGALILLLLIAFAFAKKKKDEEPPPSNGEPAVTIKTLGWESSPQTGHIYKKKGESFTQIVKLNNTGGAGDVYLKSRFGTEFLGIFNEAPTTEWFVLDRKIYVPKGESENRATFVVPQTVKEKTYDCYVGLSLEEGKVDMDYAIFSSVFTIEPLVVEPEVRVLSLAWL